MHPPLNQYETSPTTRKQHPWYRDSRIGVLHLSTFVLGLEIDGYEYTPIMENQIEKNMENEME